MAGSDHILRPGQQRNRTDSAFFANGLKVGERPLARRGSHRGKHRDRIEIVVMYLLTPRLIIRTLELTDVEPLCRMWSDPDVTQFMGGPRDYGWLVKTFTEIAHEEPQPVYDLWSVIEKISMDIIGQCGIYEKEVDGALEHELIYVFAKSAWGHGYTTEAACAVREYAFCELALMRIISLIDPENVPSIRVAEKTGFHFEKETIRPDGSIKQLYTMTNSKPS